jgi:hypothetical protein
MLIAAKGKAADYLNLSPAQKYCGAGLTFSYEERGFHWLTKGLNPFIILLLYYALHISLVMCIRNNAYRTMIRHYPVVPVVSSNPGTS